MRKNIVVYSENRHLLLGIAFVALSQFMILSTLKQKHSRLVFKRLNKITQNGSDRLKHHTLSSYAECVCVTMSIYAHIYAHTYINKYMHVPDKSQREKRDWELCGRAACSGGT